MADLPVSVRKSDRYWDFYKKINIAVLGYCRNYCWFVSSIHIRVLCVARAIFFLVSSLLLKRTLCSSFSCRSFSLSRTEIRLLTFSRAEVYVSLRFSSTNLPNCFHLQVIISIMRYTYFPGHLSHVLSKNHVKDAVGWHCIWPFNMHFRWFLEFKKWLVQDQ